MVVELITCTPLCSHNASTESRALAARQSKRCLAESGREGRNLTDIEFETIVFSCKDYFRATIATCKSCRPSANAVVMPKTPPKPINASKVVLLTQEKHKVIARDEKCQRVIIGIGSERLAFDVFTRVTHLPRGTGDQPAPVLPMSKNRKKPTEKQK